MSQERDQGGRAFPWCGDLNDKPTIGLGMTMRDYFAAHAPDPPDQWVSAKSSIGGLIEWRWFYADQMVKFRS